MATVAIARNDRALVVAPTTDRALLRRFLERDRLFAAYPLCDLDDREFGRTQWGVAFHEGEPISIALEYSGATPQPLFVMGRNDGISAILRDVIRPRAAFTAARAENLRALADHYRIDPGPPMVRMWVGAQRFQPFPADVRRLRTSDSSDLNRLYQLGFGSWLPSSAIGEGIYYGLWVGGRLMSAAGTHVISHTARIGVVGNVMTHVDFRGRGYASAVTSAVTAELLLSCDQVVLNVRSDNPPALAAYRRLGYAEHVRFEERLIHRLSSPWSELTAPIRRFFSGRREIRA
jgi:RimJ/RimL family protein N-acetyltransferase